MTTLPPELKPVDEKVAANRLGLSVRTLQMWRHTGRVALPYIKLGRSVRYRPDDLRAFMENNTVTPAHVDA